MTLQIITALLLLGAWLGLVWHTLRKSRPLRSTPSKVRPPIAVVYASQTGSAKEIAQRTVDALGPERAQLLPINHVNAAQLADYRFMLFIVSTCGEGDPPDMAQSFYRQAMAQTQDTSSLNQLNVAVLALGDRSYTHYCGFGAVLTQWLEQRGARFLFATIQADRCAPDALLSWDERLNQHFQSRIAAPDRQTNWRLAQRRHLNPHSAGGACYELWFEPPSADACNWHAGDIAEIEIAPIGVHRDYSIASTVSEGMLGLLIRQHKDADGKPGAGSRWLTCGIELGDSVRLRIRENSLFHAPAEPRPAIFIGNGTGIAGLRSVLQARIEQGHHDNWLIFGERQRACDFFYKDQLSTWHADQKLTRLDLAFSRDQAQKHYVHDIMRTAAATLRDWVARGAVLYVCGSKDGMASDVDRTLKEILGNFGYAALLERQGYRRDVY